jgi:hypothetical protein
MEPAPPRLAERREPMKQYLLSVHTGDTPYPSPEAMEKAFGEVAAFNADIQRTGAWVFGGGLHPADTATVVTAQGDNVLVTDGPFTETKEQIGGFWVIKAADADAAFALAVKASRACGQPVEVRPFQEDAPD